MTPPQDGQAAERPAPARTSARRVRVTSPRMGAARTAPARPATREIDEQTGLGEVYMTSLLRTQLRLGLSVLASTVLLLGALPLLFALVPASRDARILGVPLPWLLLGLLAYPLLLLAARYYVRHAERNERDFVDLVERQWTQRR